MKDNAETTLGEISFITTGKLDVNASDPNGSYPFFTCADEVHRINDFAFDTEAILLAGNGNFGVKHYQGKFNVYQRTYVIEPFSVDGKWLYHAVKFNIEKITKHSRGSTIKYLRLGDITGCPVTLTPLNEQRRIVEKIETLFAQLDKGEEEIRKTQKQLKLYRQSVLKAAVTGELTADWRAERAGKLEHGRDLLNRILQTRREQWQGRGKYKEPNAPNTNELPELPEGWVWSSIQQLATVMGGLTKNSKRGEMPLVRPMLRVANVYQNRLELDDIHKIGVTENELPRVTIEPRDLLVVEGNGSKDQIGRMAIWSGEIPNAVHQNHLIKVRPLEPLLAEFLLAWFQSPHGRGVVESAASSTSGLYTLSISKIEAMAAPLPCVGEVEEIVTQIEAAFIKIERLEQWCQTELKRSAALRQSILKDAFSGKLVEQDPNDEPASALLARIAAEKAQLKTKVKAKTPRRKKKAS